MNFHYTDYQPPLGLGNGHLQSIFASLTVPRWTTNYTRERICTADGDFLDLDWSTLDPLQSNGTLAIISHGLEGNSHRNYITGMVGALNRGGIDTLSWNFRGCSGQANLKLRMYHNGTIDDLHEVVIHAIDQKQYKKIFLVGFSMGGNLNLLYLGKMHQELPAELAGAVAFSVPCDLTNAATEIGQIQNWFYMQRFLRDLHKKIKAKQKLFPVELDDSGYWAIKTFKDFDDRYTAPIHGFACAEEYWQQCSCLLSLEHIAIPTLLVNSLDDPFLGPPCYPYDIAKCSEYLTFLAPQHGGHVGFVSFNPEKEYWSEKICRTFILDQEHH